MHRKHSFYFLLVILSLLFITVPAVVTAQTTTLSNNSGAGNNSWFIDGERTLIINGFDLTPRNLSFPITVDALTIAVEEAVPGASIDMVVYTDANGGSPADATLAGSAQVTINNAGTVTVPFPTPVTVNSPVMWVGFYLPVDFRFLSDTSGTSVLTYWAWTPNSTFSLSDLSSAQVLGPSDGSAPVSIDLGGIARISAQITESAGGATTPGDDTSTGDTSGTQLQPQAGTVGVQIPAQTSADLSVMSRYPYCGELIFYDSEDLSISANGAFRLFCRADLGSYSPGVVSNEDQIAAGITTMERRGYLYEVFAGGNYQKEPHDSEKLAVPVTHCIRPEQADLDEAVIGIAYGAPRAWEILPSVRYGELTCAEVTHTGFMSYFVPRTGGEPTANADLYFVGRVRLVDAEGNSDDISCGFRYELRYAIRNEGFEATPPLTLTVEDVHLRTGTITREAIYQIPAIPAGETMNFYQPGFQAPTAFFNEAHRMFLRIDSNDQLAELKENNNQYILDYLLRPSVAC